MKAGFFCAVLLFLFSCSSSRIGAGLSHDTGTIVPINREETSGFGYFIEYRWKYMIDEEQGFGLDANYHVNGYGPIGGSDGYNYKTLQWKYYRTIVNTPSSFMLVDYALGVGLGTAGPDDQALFISNLSLDLYFPKNHAFYISPKINYLHNFIHRDYNLSFEIGLGLRLKK